MEILRAFARNTTTKVINLSTFVAQNEDLIIQHLVSVIGEEDTSEAKIKNYWVRVFNHVKKQYDIKDKKFITDKESVNWAKIYNEVLIILTRNSEIKIKQMSYKRKKLHIQLHMEADREVVDLLVGKDDDKTGDKLTSDDKADDKLTSDNKTGDDDEIDAFFNHGPNFSILDIKKKIGLWKETAQRVDLLHKQDLLFYNILDFVTTRQDVAIKSILQTQYSSVKEHLSTIFILKNHLEEEVDTIMEITSNDEIKKISEEIVKKEAENTNITQSKIFLKIYELLRIQFKDGVTTFIDKGINEYHFTMAFIYPLFFNLFFNVSQKELFQRWGEVRLYCAKRNEHSSLFDAERRTPGPSIDGIFTLPGLNDLEFLVVEVTGAPAQDDFEHFIGDRNKIAKNLKIMLKFIISLREIFTCLKLYGIQVYKNDVYVYSMTNTYDNLYIFTDEMKFSFPTVPALLKKKFPQFMENLWCLKVISSAIHLKNAKYVENCLVNEETEAENVVGSGLSSPYVSPPKRKETKC
ncbi:hypothetical protein BD770DRAFT_405870 [Pilaira anomala]|nr:hypothetical protein BD770DRAFT_405870 [Pilaira anomala]